MTNQVSERSTRLAPQPSELIERGRTIEFTFNGKQYQAHPGDTIASALYAAGVRTLSRSFKYHRPRGVFCATGHCPNCLVQIGDEPNVRSCQRPVEPGMVVKPQNAWPSLDVDMMSLTQLAGRFLPVGFYYKLFMWPKPLWPFYESILRRAAGLGEVDAQAPHHYFDKAYRHADVLVVGGGRAGLAAALEAAAQGAHVLILDENSSLGGRLRADPQTFAEARNLANRAADHENIDILTDTVAFGWYDDNWIGAVQRVGGQAIERLIKIRAGALVVASGAVDRQVHFYNNDLPGNLLASGARRLLHLYGVRLGERALVVSANDDGLRLAGELLDAGTALAAVVDARASLPESPDLARLRAAGVDVLAGHTVQAAHGNGRVTGADIVPVAADGRAAGAARQVACDLIVQALGYVPSTDLLYEAGARFQYDERLSEFTLAHLPAGVFAAGHAAAIHEAGAIERSGRLAGLEAAGHAGFAGDGQAAALAELRRQAAADREARPVYNAPFYIMPDGRGKSFVCICEDVTEKDVKDAVAEGYNSVELLKRYSTISMGPCQGKMCSPSAMALCARENGWTIAATGTTTARPPATPLSMGALGGRLLEPVALSPLHDWNVENGARMINAGAFKRAETYPNYWQGDKYAEIRAVRERVGIIDVSTLGKIELRGPAADVTRVLERLYVNKWKGLAVGRVRYGVMCNDEGVVMDDGVTARLADDLYYMTTTSTGSSGVYEWILWWLQSGWAERLHVVNMSDAYAAVNVAGPRARDLLAKLTDLDLSNAAFPYMHVRAAQVAGVPVRLLRIGFTGELSYEMHFPSGYARYMWETLLAAGQEFGILPFGLEAQRVLRLEKKHLIIGQDTDAISNAIEADLAWAVKLDKEDFLGKAALATINRAGKRNALLGFEMVEPGVVAEEGNQIVEPGPDGRPKIIGYVTSSRWSPTLNKAVGLCWLPAAFAAAGTEFNIRLNGALRPARVVLEPFYDPQGERLRS